MTKNKLDSSFRDPDGYLFTHEGKLYRKVEASYREEYDHLIKSGLYRELSDSLLIVPHEEVDRSKFGMEDAHAVLSPQTLPFISYPYEWCFDQLNDAALHTLKVEKAALKRGMSLKDASSYNIQFHKGRPIFIDTLSFEKYAEGSPWAAYRQFCQHFLAPLALMSLRDSRLSQLLRVYVDGIPLDLASLLLPLRTRLKFGVLTHVHLHAKSQRRYAERALPRKGRIGKFAFLALLDSLESTINSMRIKSDGHFGWSAYYDRTNYTQASSGSKKSIVEEFINQIKPGTLWDLGANNGEYSRIASRKGILTVSADFEHCAVNENYIICKSEGDANIIPILLDLSNPSPDLGWANRERDSLVKRGPADTVMALALIHHLAIGNNLPFDRIASFLASICRSLIIEFVPKDDSQVVRLLSTRKDIFPSYDEASFIRDFSNYFEITAQKSVEGSLRKIFLMRRKAERHT